MKFLKNKMPCITMIRSAYINENGAALVIGLMFLAILGLLGSTAVVLTTTDMKIGSKSAIVIMVQQPDRTLSETDKWNLNHYETF